MKRIKTPLLALLALCFLGATTHADTISETVTVNSSGWFVITATSSSYAQLLTISDEDDNIVAMWDAYPMGAYPLLGAFPDYYMVYAPYSGWGTIMGVYEFYYLPEGTYTVELSVLGSAWSLDIDTY